jgi:nucleoid DNA-binding protein
MATTRTTSKTTSAPSAPKRATGATAGTAVKATASKPAAAKPARTPAAIQTPYTKTQLLAAIAESTELSRKDIQAVLDALGGIMERHIKKRGAGVFTLPGLLKIRVVRKPATKARKGTNPFTGEETVFQAKPARNMVKVAPLKKLKDMAA